MGAAPNTESPDPCLNAQGLHAAQCLRLGAVVLVRFDLPPGSRANRNVLAFDAEHRLLWQIAESPHGTEADQPFMSLALDAQGQVVVGNWNGVTYRVDLASGALTVCDFNR